MLTSKQLILPLFSLLISTTFSFAANLTTIARFPITTEAPDGWLIGDAAGNLYGTTFGDASSNWGSVFEISAGSHALTTLAVFNGSNGADPSGGLWADPAGNLYGTTNNGGINFQGSASLGNGAVFKIAAGTHALTTLAAFTGTASQPSAGVIGDSAGNLYGTSWSNGATNDGAVFKIDAVTHNYSIVASLTAATTGSAPHSQLVADKDGNLFGTAEFGGPNNAGTIFKVDHTTNALTALVSFGGANGIYPDAGLIMDASGNLFGTAFEGGPSNNGTIFELPAGSHTVNTLATFNGANGSRPRCKLVEDAAGNLFGTTVSGGSQDYGTAFELPSGSSSIVTLANFDWLTTGGYPETGLYADSAGNLFGTTDQGSSIGAGTVFEITNSGFVAAPEPASAGILSLAALFAQLRPSRRRHN
jgi:uncharacterized repeat protein (TIGR03803 family)